MLGAEEAASLTDIPNSPQKGTRLGNWLTREQARELLAIPDRSTHKGKRDYVILALLVGCALRRNELAELDVATIQQHSACSPRPKSALQASCIPSLRTTASIQSWSMLFKKGRSAWSLSKAAARQPELHKE